MWPFPSDSRALHRCQCPLHRCPFRRSAWVCCSTRRRRAIRGRRPSARSALCSHGSRQRARHQWVRWRAARPRRRSACATSPWPTWNLNSRQLALHLLLRFVNYLYNCKGCQTVTRELVTSAYFSACWSQVTRVSTCVGDRLTPPTQSYSVCWGRLPSQFEKQYISFQIIWRIALE